MSNLRTIEEIRQQFGDEAVSAALHWLHFDKAAGLTKEESLEYRRTAKFVSDKILTDSRMAAALLLRTTISWDDLPPEDAEVVDDNSADLDWDPEIPQADSVPAGSNATKREQEDLTDDEREERLKNAFPGSLANLWELQAALRLSKSDSNGLDILQTAVTAYLLRHGIQEPGLQEQFDRQQEEYTA